MLRLSEKDFNTLTQGKNRAEHKEKSSTIRELTFKNGRYTGYDKPLEVIAMEL